MQIPVDVYFIGIGVITAIPSSLKLKTDLYLKLFPFFLVITILIEVLGAVLSDRNIHTTMMYNVFTSFEFIFYFWMLGHIIRNTQVKTAIKTALVIYPILAVTDILFIAGPEHFHTITNAIGCLMIVFLCIFYFLELFQLPHSLNLFTEPAFWICSGLLFFYTVTFAIFGVTNLVGDFLKPYRQTFSDIVDISNILLYSSFAIAFLCRVKARKSL